MTTSTTFNANTTFVNCSEAEELKFINTAREHFENVESTLKFYSEHGTSEDSYEHADKTRRDLLDEGFNRSEVREIEEILKTFDEVGSFYEYGLCFDFIEADENSDGYYRFQICWRGPSSEIRFFENGNIEAVYMDWFVGVGFNVSTWESFEWLESQFKETCMMEWESKTWEEKCQEAHTFEEEEECDY